MPRLSSHAPAGRSRESGLTLVELMVASAIGIGVVLVFSWMLVSQTKQTHSVGQAVDADVDARLADQAIRAAVGSAIPQSLWINSSDPSVPGGMSVSNALSLGWQSFDLAAGGGLGGSVFWGSNLVLDANHAYAPVTPSGPPDPSGNAIYDLVAIVQKSPRATILSLAPSSDPTGAYIIQASTTAGNQKNQTFNVSADPTAAGYGRNDVVGLSVSGGVEFAQVTDITPTTLALDWSNLGTFSVGGTQMTLPESYLTAGVPIFKALIVLIGTVQSTDPAMNGLLQVLQLDLASGNYTALYTSTYPVQTMRVLSATTALSPLPAAASPLYNLSAQASGYVLAIVFKRPSLTGVAIPAGNTNNVTTITIGL